jgi:O-antigen/teichoic acid export membrane protein
MLARHCLSRQPVAWHAVSMPQWRAMVAFGLPMLAHEAASIVLSMGDRTLVQQHLGAESLGVYVAAYNLCDYLRAALLAAAVAAAQPAYLRLHAEEGGAATAAFLGRFVHLYAVAAAGLVAVVSAIGAPLLEVLASPRYVPGAVVVPWVMTALALDTLVVVLGAGLYLHKRTRRIALAVFASALLNLGANAWLLPRIGLVGAGIAAVAGYGLLLVLCACAGRQALVVPLPWVAVIRAVAMAIVAWLAAVTLDAGSAIGTLALRTGVALAVYAAGMAWLDTLARQVALDLARRVAGRWRTTRSDA